MSLMQVKLPEEENAEFEKPISEEAIVVTNHEKKIEALVYLSNGLFATGSLVGELKFWDWHREEGKEGIAEMQLPSRAPVKEMLQITDTALLVANSDGFIYAVDVARFLVICTFNKAHGKSSIATMTKLIVPEVEGDTLFASAAFDGQVRVWSFERRGLVAFIQAHNMGINKVVEMTKTGELVTAGNDRALKVFRTDLFNESVE